MDRAERERVEGVDTLNEPQTKSATFATQAAQSEWLEPGSSGPGVLSQRG